MRMGREDVEIADLKEPAKVKWVPPEAQNCKPSLQQDAQIGARDAPGLHLLIRIRRQSQINHAESLHRGNGPSLKRQGRRESCYCKSPCCQSSPLTKPCNEKISARLECATSPFQTYTCKQLVQKNVCLSVMRDHEVRELKRKGRRNGKSVKGYT